MGRSERELSPMKVALIPCPAKSPSNNRVVVPEFPQSRGSFGSVNFPPLMTTSSPSSRIRIPHASRHLRVDITSAPVDRLDMRDVPSANAANMSDRWEMDLSPGNVISPLMPIRLQFICKEKCQLNGLISIQPGIAMSVISI